MRILWRLTGAFTAQLAVPCLLLTLGCSKSGGGIDGDDQTQDHTPPAVISDLQMVRFDTTSVSLRWTARGDDGDSGRATAYDIRYSLQWITDSLWDSATSATGLPTPGTSQSVDSCTVTGLLTDSTYHFAIRSRDERGNESGLSNVVAVACIFDYSITIVDTAFERILRFYLYKPTGEIMRSEMLRLTQLSIQGQHVHSLSGIEYCRNLYELRMWNNRVTDLSPLSGLAKLRILEAGYNGITDIASLASLVRLQTLILNSNAISDITPLIAMDSLVDLRISTNALWNLMALDGKATITNLELENNQLTHLGSLWNLTGLNKARLNNNQIDDLLGLAYNTGLTAGDSIWLTGNPLGAPTTDSIVDVLRDRGAVVIY